MYANNSINEIKAKDICRLLIDETYSFKQVAIGLSVVFLLFATLVAASRISGEDRRHLTGSSHVSVKHKSQRAGLASTGLWDR